MSEADGEKRVGFLIAGAQKAGTTALFDYLAEIPELELPAVKEAHFFDQMRPRHFARAIEAEDARKRGIVEPVFAREDGRYARVYGVGSCVGIGWGGVDGFCVYEDAGDICQTVLGAGLVAPKVEGRKEGADALAWRTPKHIASNRQGAR